MRSSGGEVRVPVFICPQNIQYEGQSLSLPADFFPVLGCTSLGQVAWGRGQPPHSHMNSPATPADSWTWAGGGLSSVCGPGNPGMWHRDSD